MKDTDDSASTLPLKKTDAKRTSSDPVNEPLQKQTVSWNIGKTILDDYVIKDVLGQGGMGTVYLVERAISMGKLRFAVKTLLTSTLTNEDRKRAFLRELRTWIDLPEHPNLTACRFFRTIEDRLAIFSEYVSGGSLQQWIRKKKLIDIEQIMDVAIQVAWGLHAAHENGVIHQDVKPANVLMADDGTAKVTDFGLSRALHTSGFDIHSNSGADSVVVSSGGLTIAYCSPEQAGGMKLNRRTDVWSWGLTLFEMFTGRMTWRFGFAAPKVLEIYLSKDPNPPYPPMPVEVVDVLKKCFEENPKNRWDTLAEVADVLKDVFTQLTGKEYPREVPCSAPPDINKSIVYTRREREGGIWEDPLDWLKSALAAAGRDLTEVEHLVPDRKGSRKAQSLVDLEIYEIAERIYSSLIGQGRWDLEYEYAELLSQKSSVLKEIDDDTGSLTTIDRSIDIMERLVFQDDRSDLLRRLAILYTAKAIVLARTGDKLGAIDLSTRAIQITERLLETEYREDLVVDLALDYSNKGLLLSETGDNRKAVECYDQSIKLINNNLPPERLKQAYGLGVIYANKALAQWYLGDNHGVIASSSKSIEILETLVYVLGKSECRPGLTQSYTNYALGLTELGDHQDALQYRNKIIEILEQLVINEKRSDYWFDLAWAYMNKGFSLRQMGKGEDGLILYTKSIEIFERLVFYEGQTEQTNKLINVYINTANTYKDLQKNEKALELCDKAAAMTLESCKNDKGKLAEIDEIRGDIMSNLGDYTNSLDTYDNVIKIYEDLIHKQNKPEYIGSLAMIQAKKAYGLLKCEQLEEAGKLAKIAVSVLHEEANRTGSVKLIQALERAEKELKPVV